MLTAVVAAVLSAPQAPPTPPEPVTIAVTGTVLGDDLRPAAGVCVGVLHEENGDIAAALARPLARSETEGGFRADVALSKQHLGWLVVGGGHWATAVRELSTVTGPMLDLGAFAMAPGITGAGRVRDEKGQPIAGALVVVGDLLDSRQFLREGREGMAVKCRTAAVSDRSGIFRLTGMVQSAGQLVVSKDGCYEERLQPVGSGDPLDVTLSPSPALRGRVVDEAASAVAGASVSLGTASTVTDEEGRFALNLRRRADCPGEVSAYKLTDGKQLRARCRIDAPGTDIELRLSPRTPAPASQLRVVARGPDGAAVAGFTAYVSWNPQNQLQYRPDAMLLARAAKSEQDWCAAATDGTAVVRGSRRDGDTAVVFVRADGFAWGRVETDDKAVGGEPVVVTLGREAVVRGRVTDAAAGKPIAGAEVIPTQRLTANERGFYGSNGFRSIVDLSGAPAATKTDQDGRYELRGLPGGDTDLFVYVKGRIELAPVQLKLAEGGAATMDFAVPANVTLRATIPGHLPAGALVRVHWHRPNMSSSGWSRDFDGAVDLGADGSFTIAGLHPKPYAVQLLCAPPPRGGHLMKLVSEIWNGAAANDPPVKLANPAPVLVTGKVAGSVPWQRLAVAACWQEPGAGFTVSFELRGPVALVQPDRSFRLSSPKHAVHVLLFDVLTGAALEWQELAADGAPPLAVTFAGAAEEVPMVLDPGSTAEFQRVECQIEYKPDREHWPGGIGGIATNGMRAPTNGSGMVTEARAGDTVSLWLPARAGTLLVRRQGLLIQSVELDSAPPGPITVDIAAVAKPR